jgi:hypothetical protein
MEQSDARRAAWRCSAQAFITIRATARHGAHAADAVPLGLAPGFDEAGLLIAEVASAGLAISAALEEGTDGEELLVAAWAAVGEVGRQWLVLTIRDLFSQWTAEDLVTVVGAPRVSARAGRRAVHGNMSSSARWCRAILTCGYTDIREIASTERPRLVDSEARQLIYAIAECCHRIPYPEELPAFLRSWLIPRYLGDAWDSIPADGRRWCHDRSTGLRWRAPRAIERILACDAQR